MLKSFLKSIPYLYLSLLHPSRFQQEFRHIEAPTAIGGYVIGLLATYIINIGVSYVYARYGYKYQYYQSFLLSTTIISITYSITLILWLIYGFSWRIAGAKILIFAINYLTIIAFWGGVLVGWAKGANLVINRAAVLGFMSGQLIGLCVIGIFQDYEASSGAINIKRKRSGFNGWNAPLKRVLTIIILGYLIKKLTLLLSGSETAITFFYSYAISLSIAVVFQILVYLKRCFTELLLGTVGYFILCAVVLCGLVVIWVPVYLITITVNLLIKLAVVSYRFFTHYVNKLILRPTRILVLSPYLFYQWIVIRYKIFSSALYGFTLRLMRMLIISPYMFYQRRKVNKGIKAELQRISQEALRVTSIEDLSDFEKWLEILPSKTDQWPSGLYRAKQAIINISRLSQEYQDRLTVNGQLIALEEIRREVIFLRNTMRQIKTPLGEEFFRITINWLYLIKVTESQLRDEGLYVALRNPYIVGNPLQLTDKDLFVGRHDIKLAIEKYMLVFEQHPALMLYGKRRAGKSSTLKNLPRLLSRQFEPVYMDCQDAKWHESDQAFCFNLAHEIFVALQQRETVRGIAQPQLEQFETNAFTRLDQYLDQFEKLIQQRGKRILLSFDEYEALEESITNADISKNVLGKLRNIIQHRERIVVLVSGSHRFDELTGLNWASYLINTRTLELSFLDEASARELLTQPVPKLQYEDGVVDEIVRITHCQPYLLQAVASELVNYLNDQQRTTATMDDLNVTIEKVLVSAGSYFANTWAEGRSDEEQSVMLALAMGEAVDWAAHPTALRNLLNAEIVEASGNEYQLTIDLFRRWILKHKAPVQIGKGSEQA